MNTKNTLITILTALLIASFSLGAGLLLADGGSGGDSEESGVTLALDEIFDAIRNGVRLVMFYDTTTQSFIGVVVNTTTHAIPAVRVEVHLSNGVELGPTTPGDLTPGEARLVTLSTDSTPGFDGWTPHAESGGGEGGGEHSSGSESGNGEHDSGGESGNGEHGSSGE